MKIDRYRKCLLVMFMLYKMSLSAYAIDDHEDYQLYNDTPPPGREYWSQILGDFRKLDDVLRVYDTHPFVSPKSNDPIRKKNKFFIDAQNIHKKVFDWQKAASKNPPPIGCEGICRGIYQKPNPNAIIVGVLDVFSRIFLNGKILNPNPSFRIYSGTNKFLTVTEVQHIVYDGRIIEWVKIPTPDKSEAWLPLNPFGNAKAPLGTKDGDVIPVNFRISYVMSLKNSKFTERFCIEDIKDGEVSFYAFMLSPEINAWLSSKMDFTRGTGVSKAFDDLDMEKLHESEKKEKPWLTYGIRKSEPVKNLIDNFLDRLEPFKPQLFKMPLEKFYFSFLSNGMNWQPPLNFPSFIYPVDCMLASRFMFKDVGGFEERKKWLNQYPTIFENASGSYSFKDVPLVSPSDIDDAKKMMNSYYSDLNFKRSDSDMLIEYIKAPSLIPGAK